MTNIFNTIRYKKKRINFLEVYTVVLKPTAITMSMPNKN